MAKRLATSGKVKVQKCEMMPWGLVNIHPRANPWLVEMFWSKYLAKEAQKELPHLTVVRLTGTVYYTVAK